MGWSGRALKALLVDASDAHGAALRSALEAEFSPCAVEAVQGSDGLTGALMRRGWDVVLYSGEAAGSVPPGKARALVRLADPHLPFISVSPSVRPHDLLAVVQGFGGDVPVVSDPARAASASREQMDAADSRRHGGDTHRLLLAQQAITHHVASGAEPPVLLESVMRSLAEVLGWSYAELWRPHSESDSLICTASWAALDSTPAVALLAERVRGSALVAGRGLAGRVFAFRRPAWVANVHEESGAEAAAGLACGVAFPIAGGDRCDGVIVLYAPDPREPDAEQAAMLAGVGSQLARYLDSRRDHGEPLRYLDVAGTMIVVLDADGRVTRANRRTCTVLGRAEEEVLGRDWFEIALPESERAARRVLFERLLGGEVAEEELAGDECPVLTVTGERRTVTWHSAVLRADDGTLLGALASGDDITEARRSEEQAAFLAHHDPLTGLPNRALLEEHLKLALARSRRTASSVALLHIDLDDFKLVNDSLGHGAGDELLEAKGERAQQLVRSTDLLARVGGDEFLLLLADLAEDPLAVAERVTGQILHALAEPFSIREAEFQVSVSIGVSGAPHHALDAETLLAHADAAMYQAKQVARGGWTVYNEALGDPLARLSLTARLRRALRNDEFQLHYQPIADLGSGSLFGVEALIRWLDPEQGMVAPGDFIPIAEETGLIESLGDWVVGAVCRQQVEWAARGLHPRISFNVSPRQLKRLDFADRVTQHLTETGADPRRLTIELTESSTFQDHLLTEPLLHQLHDLGFTIALDDFGSGYSSLSRLREMPVETLKIDRAFLDGVPENREAAAIVTAILRLSRALGRTAVAEGVETEEQRRFLQAQRCPLAQGYLFGRPLPAVAVEELMLRAAAA
jgi:diguanylate cyclase (GGDEF)-like protein/PAS domain S-box-containing protein